MGNDRRGGDLRLRVRMLGSSRGGLPLHRAGTVPRLAFAIVHGQRAIQARRWAILRRWPDVSSASRGRSPYRPREFAFRKECRLRQAGSRLAILLSTAIVGGITAVEKEVRVNGGAIARCASEEQAAAAGGDARGGGRGDGGRSRPDHRRASRPLDRQRRGCGAFCRIEEVERSAADFGIHVLRAGVPSSVRPCTIRLGRRRGPP